MPFPTYRPRDANFFLAPFAGGRIPSPMGYTRAHGGRWPGTPAYPIPETGGPLRLVIEHEAGAYSEGDGASSPNGTSSPPPSIRVPFAAGTALASGLAGAGLGAIVGSPTHRGRNAAIGGVLGALAGGSTAWWLATNVAKRIEGMSSKSSGTTTTTEAGFTPGEQTTQVAVRAYEQSYPQTPWPGTTTPPPPPAHTYAPFTPIPPEGPPAKPGGDTPTTTGASSVDAKTGTEDKPVPWGWIIGGSLAALAVGGGIVWAVSTSKRRRRARR